MRIIVLLLCLLFAVGSTRAQIYYTDVNPDETYSLTATAFGQFDITGNGQNDVLVAVGQNSGQNFINFTTPSFGIVGSANVEQLISSGSNVARLNAGASIGPTGSYGQGNTVNGGVAIKSPADWPNGTTDAYVGFRFERLSTNTTHYGWIRIDVTNNRGQVTIKDYAYETNPNTAILAGDQGSVLVTNITVSSQSGANTITTNGGTLQMIATVTPSNATNPNVTWSVIPGTGNATINSSGLLTATADGTVTVRATAQDGSGVTDDFTVTISNQVILVNSISVYSQSGATTITTDGGTLQMQADVLPSNADNPNVTWSVIPGTGDATITSAGLLTAVANGSVTVRATAQDGSGVFGEEVINISGQIVLVSSITVSSQSGANTISTNNGTLQMVATVSPSNATNQNVTWSVIPGTGDASINTSGLLTAIDNGTVTVRATAQDGSGAFDDFTVTISNQVVLVSSISVTTQSGANTITTDGGTLQMVATVSPSNATNQSVTWSVIAGSGNATITSGGLLTATANGSVTVRATAQDGSGAFGEMTITISGQIVLVANITVSTQSGANSITVDDGTLQMTATISPSNATNQNVTWSVIPGTGDATINTSGLLTAVDNGSVTVRATAQDGSGAFDELLINISNQITLVSSITVTGQGGATSITTNGGTLQMVASVSPSNATDQSVTWSVINGTGTATINASGLLTATTNGTVTVRATAQDGSGVFGEEVITISNQIVLVSSITVSSQSGANTITTNGGTLQMTATISPSNATNQNVTWSVITGTGDATINASGLLTAVADGTVTVRADAQDASGAFDEFTVTISGQIILVTNITISSQSGANTITTNGGTLQMLATVTPSNATNPNVTWSVIPGTGDATIDAAGLLTATQNGTITVRADAQDASGAFDEFTVTISGQIVLVSSITVSSQSGANTITTDGGTLQMTATITPSNATNQNVTWSVIPGTGDATINTSGLLTAVADGTVTVRADAQDASGEFDEFTVTISGQIILVTDITISSQSGSSTITTNGGTLQMLATVTPSGATNPNVTWSVIPGTGNATIDAAGLLTATQNGTITVRADAQDASGEFDEFTVTISGQIVLVSSITVGTQSGATTITTNAGTLQMTATISPSNATNQNVTWSVIPGTGDATINTSGLLTAVADGTVTVRATAQDGSGATDDLVITISGQIILVTDITISSQSGSSTITTNGGTLQMIATVTPSNATNPNVTWSVIPGTGDATIDAAGLLTATQNGTITVRADAQDASGEFDEFTVTISGQIVLVSSITVGTQSGATTITTNAGTLQMTAAISPSNATNQNVTWSVIPGTGDATINASGLLTAVADGTVTVRATAQDGSGVTDDLVITISNQIVLVSSITVSSQSGSNTITTNAGTLQMVATISPSNASNQNVSWSVIPGTGNASIDAAGLLTASSDGTVTVRATAQDGSGVFDDFGVTISNQTPPTVSVSSITVSSQSGATVITTNGGTLQMVATVSPSNATNQNVSWSVIPGTGDATIDASGLLTAVADGTVTVRATAQDGSGVTDDLIITISNQIILVSNITVSSQSGATTITTNGGTLQMQAAVTPSNATNQNVTWSVINGSGTATITTAGVLTATSNGTVTVRATAQDGSGEFGELVINISGQVVLVSGITVSTQSGATTITTNGGTLQMVATVTPSNATNQNITWSVTPGTGNATINGSGVLTATANGTVTVTATAQDGSGVTDDLIITISNQIVLVSNITVSSQSGATTITTNGGTLQMQASVSPSNATNQNVTWSVINGSGTATITTAGVLTATSNGTVTVRATAQDGSGEFGELVINISGQVVLVSGITVSTQSGATTITTNGGTLQMVATVTPSNATNQNVTWSVTPGTGNATINGSGVLTATADGTVTVTATAQDGSGVTDDLVITISSQVVLVSNITVSSQSGATTITTNGGTLQMQAAILPTNATNQNVTWSVINGSGTATITAAGVLTATSNGTVTVRATAQDGSGEFGELVINISGQVVLVSGITVSTQSGATTITTNGGTLQMVATVTPSNATNQNITWSVTPGTGNATINASGVLTATANGTVTVTATAQDGSGVTDDLVITISNQVILVSNITVTTQSGATTITTNGGTLQMQAAILPTNATNQNVTWSVINGSGTATITTAGLLTATGNGTVTVRATAQDGSGTFGELVINISGQVVLVSSITVASQSGATTINTSGGTLQMVANITPTNATNQNVTWSVINGTGTATINASGLLTGTSNGTVTVRADAQDGSGAFDELTITINNQIILVNNIAVQGQGGASTISANGGTLQMEATISPSNATNQSVTWSVINGSGSATINATGLLTAQSNGSVTVRATAQDGSGVFGEAVITISGQIVQVTNITVASQSGATTIAGSGGTLQMVATITPSNATNQNVTWSVIPGTGGAVINSSGLLTAQSNGTVTVRATAQDGSGVFGEQVITISNQLILVNSIAVTTQSGANSISTNGGTLQMVATVSPTTATNQNVSWSVSAGTGNATISSAGILTATANGTVTVIATAQDGSGTTGSMVITISGQIILVNNITVTSQSGATTITTSGGSLQMVANITPTNATNQNVTWSVTNGTGTAFINTSGLLTAQTNGTVTVRATAQDGSGVFGEQVITLSNQTNNILVASIAVQGQGGVNSINVNGGFLQMQATILPTNATNQAVSWSVTPGTGNATITPSGVLQALANGTVTVVATAQDGSGTTGSQVVTISNQNTFVPVTDINITSQSGATVITTNGGSLQMVASVVPTNATIQTVTWSLTPAGGDASITATGILFAIDNGNVWVVARANDGSGVRDSVLIGISNQAATVPISNIEVIGNGGGSTISTPGGTLQLFAIVQPSNATDPTVAWRVNPVTGNATIDQNGLLRGVVNGNGTVWAVAEATDGSGVSDSLLVTISNQLIIGVEEVPSLSRVELFPNPCDAYLNLRFETQETGTAWIRIFDVQGRLIRELQPALFIGDNQLQVETADLPSGQYLLRLQIGEQQQTQRFIKR